VFGYWQSILAGRVNRLVRILSFIHIALRMALPR
jgi:hypothetical protein